MTAREYVITKEPTAGCYRWWVLKDPEKRYAIKANHQVIAEGKSPSNAWVNAKKAIKKASLESEADE